MTEDSDSISGPSYRRNTWTSLRSITILSFLLAIPLCVAHGVISHRQVPAVGLAPQAISAASTVFLSRQRRRCGRDDDPVKLTRSVMSFAIDTILAAGLMVVLVFTWIDLGASPSINILAAYATIPLLVNLWVTRVGLVTSYGTLTDINVTALSICF